MSDVMDRPEVSLTPPAPTAPKVLQHRKRLEADRDALRTGAAELTRRSALGDTAARAEVRSIPGKIDGLQFEIDQCHAAHELAQQHDAAAEAAWLTSIQSMDPEALLEGIGKDCCGKHCQPGVACVITGAFPYAAAQCGHPIREKHAVFGRDETGRRRFRYDHNPQALRIFTAARKRLKVGED